MNRLSQRILQRSVPGLSLLVALLFLAGFATTASAAGKRFALVVGNAAYQGKTLKALKNPANDAALIAGALKKADFEVELVMDADLRTMKRSVQAFGQKVTDAGPGAMALFYYSGHGFQANGTNYLAPLGADLKDEVDAEFEALSVDWVLARLEKAHKGVNVVVLDACRNTALSRGMGDQGQGLALLSRTPTGSFISFATAPGSTATDGDGINSPYSAAIASEILKPGQTIEEVFKNVRRAVVEASGGDQVPWDHSSLTEDVVFLPKSGGQTPDTASGSSGGAAGLRVELQLWNDVKDSGSAEQIRVYLDKYPEGAFAAIAKARLASLGGEGDPAQRIEKLFAQLASRSLLVEQPKRPHEFYANARLREIQGDYPKARADYLKYFAFRERYVDPHYRFQNFLKVQEGRAGAREVYNSIAGGQAGRTLTFVSMLLLDREERVAGLKSLLEADPDFAPAVYELSRDYSLARLGRQSTADKREEHRLLTRFMELVEKGRFLRYFIDQQMAANQVEDARTRLASLSFLDQKALANPVRLNPVRSNQGWMISLMIADQAQEIFIALPGEEFRSTGFLPNSVNPSTGKPIPMPMFELSGAAEKQTIRVRYADIRGEVQGPYDIVFDPVLALVAGQKQILEQFTTGWISYRHYNGKLLVYFSHLVSYRCSLASVRYGIDSETPDREFPLSECNTRDPHSVRTADGRDSKIYMSVPRSTGFMSVQLTYRDGTQSAVKRFEAPAR